MVEIFKCQNKTIGPANQLNMCSQKLIYRGKNLSPSLVCVQRFSERAHGKAGNLPRDDSRLNTQEVRKNMQKRRGVYVIPGKR